ncbi:MAG: asparagine synthase (glutamine-hydrolyzing) [Nitrospinae bacterium]|nr:asparagine synthase (glutamine-hydrolyzing) [Nitrospinota bacterium]
MCGIAGFVTLDPRRPVDPAPLHAMLRRLEHRGPDDQGVHVDQGVVLGHRRLSVIDVSGGHQPLYGAVSTTVIIGNGEIYNYRELKRELSARGHRFHSASDTEVAAHAYDAWGLDFLDRLDGMYALALWDGHKRRLVLVRDRLGEKPLFYTIADGLLIFASELTALLAHPTVPIDLDARALSAYLALEYVPAPLSMIRGVGKLEPGTALVVENGVSRTLRYWRPEARPASPPLPYRAAVQRLREHLEEAVNSRLVSDVPLGIFLSGGIDSSTVAALAARSGALKTFSIGFQEQSFDERAFARAVARRIGSTHHERILRAEEMPELVPRLATILDEPLGDASILPTALLSAFAREHVTVVLGGDGGDELFGGYPMYQAQRVALLARVLPCIAYRALRAMTRRIPVSHRNFALGFKAITFLRGAAEPPPWNHALWMCSFSPPEQQALLTLGLWEAAGRGEAAFEVIHRSWAQSAGAPSLARATHLDATTYLPNDILTKVDRASMAVALEVRSPFLTRSVVEFAFSLPDVYRMRGLSGKRILRDAMRDLLPDGVLRRPKKGFGIPVGAWLKGPLQPLVRELLGAESIRRAGLFQPVEVGRLLREHEQGRADHRKPLWTLLVFELWRRHNLARPVPDWTPIAAAGGGRGGVAVSW